MDDRILLAGRTWRLTVVDAPAPGKGHDRWLARDGIAAVADGATPLVAGAGDPGEFAAGLLKGLADHTGMAARTRLATALEGTDAAPGVSATLGTVIDTPAGPRAVVLGDCVVVELRDGVARLAEDKRLGRLDDRALRVLRRRLAAGDSAGEARAGIEPTLLANRERLNTEKGYWVTVPEGRDAARHAILRVIDPAADALVICSDGFARAWTVFGLATPAAIAARDATGLADLVRQLRNAERAATASPELAQFSVHDDATALVLVADRPQA